MVATPASSPGTRRRAPPGKGETPRLRAGSGPIRARRPASHAGRRPRRAARIEGCGGCPRCSEVRRTPPTSASTGRAWKPGDPGPRAGPPCGAAPDRGGSTWAAPGLAAPWARQPGASGGAILAPRGPAAREGRAPDRAAVSDPRRARGACTVGRLATWRPGASPGRRARAPAWCPPEGRGPGGSRTLPPTSRGSSGDRAMRAGSGRSVASASPEARPSVGPRAGPPARTRASSQRPRMPPTWAFTRERIWRTGPGGAGATVKPRGSARAGAGPMLLHASQGQPTPFTVITSS